MFARNVSMNREPNQNRPAGDFSAWLRQTHQALKSKSTDAIVPCDDCSACCRSSLFIHIKSEEKQTLSKIPKNLLFSAPGLPKGNVLMGYDSSGKCPMFQNNKCAIYEFRPQTCREFDCRVFAATRIELNNEAQSLIADRVRQWAFEYPGDQDQSDLSTLSASVKFLRDRKNLFPTGVVPNNPTQLAVFAIKVFQVFEVLGGAKLTNREKLPDVEIAKRILEALAEF
jgi:Fe-S-cluster containining protein